MKYAIVEIYEDIYGEFRNLYVCVDETQGELIYPNSYITQAKIFDTEADAVEWGNQNIVPVRNGKNIFRVVSVHEKDIFVARLEG